MFWWLLSVFVCLFGAGVFFYNRLVTDLHRVKSGWSDIDVQLKRRHDLIPKLVSAVRQYAAYEQSTLDLVTSLRSQAQQSQMVKDQAAVEQKLGQGLAGIFALQESYPQLKASQNFLQLQSDISLVENHIQFARRYYNGAVRNLNTRVDSFPDLIVARLFGFRAAEYFELSEVSIEN